MLWLISSWFSTTKDWHYMHGRTSWLGATAWIMFYWSMVSNLGIGNPFHSYLHQWDKLYFYQWRNLTEPLQLYCWIALAVSALNKPVDSPTEKSREFVCSVTSYNLDQLGDTWSYLNPRYKTWNLTMLELCLILKFFPHLTSSLGSIQLVYASKDCTTT